MTEYGRSPERSIVTLLAFDTVGSTEQIADLDPDDAQIFLDRILAYLRSRVEREGGIVASFHGDGGFGIFGWPDSMEDHADRACEAAWNIQHPANPHDVPVSPNGGPVAFRIGVHSGLVGFRQLQTGVGTNFDLVGANVHVAASLQKAAPSNGIVISGDTRVLCRNTLSLQQYDSLGAGLANISQFYLLSAQPQPLGSRQIAADYPFPIVGREAERHRVTEALKPRAGRAAAAALIGEPGIGKTRLATSIAADWRAHGHPVFVFAGNARKQTTPFTLPKSLIASVLGVEEDGGEDGIIAALAAAGIPQTHVAELAASVFRPADGPEVSARTQTTRQVANRLVRTLATLTAQIHPHLLIEDVHLIDPESLECLTMMATDGDCAHMAILMTGRPEAEAAAAAVADAVLRLEPMDPSEMAAMASKMSGEQAIDEKDLAAALEQADGVPFVLEQLLLSSHVQPGRRRSNLPQTVESLIHGRLNVLSKQAKSIVQTISVLGDEVEPQLASRLLEAPAEELKPYVDELAGFGLLRGGGSDERLRFQHSIIAAACLNTVPKLKRKRVHQAAVDAIIAVYPQADSQYERLAYHAEGAGDGGMALDYLWLAGVRARRSAAPASLLTIFRRAEACIEETGDKERHVDFVLLACAALLQIGEFEEMEEAVPKALETARRLGNPDKLCGILCQLGTLQWFDGRNQDALGTLTEAHDLAEQLRSPPLVFASQLMLASVLHGLGRIEEAISLQRALCDRLTDELATARLGAAAVPSSMASAFLGWFLVEAGAYDEALEQTETALKIAERHRDPYAEVLARNAQGRVLLYKNRPADATRTMMAAKRICDREGFDAIIPHVTGRLATAMARAGDTGEAVRVAGEVAEKTSRDRTGYLETFNLRLGYGEALYRNGQREAGLAEIDAALAMASQIDNPCLRLQALGVRIAVLGLNDTDDPRIAEDRREEARLCDAYGLVAWAP